MAALDDDEALARCMLKLLAQRGPESSACPSEVARIRAPNDWRAHMDSVRRVAAHLSEQGQLDILQKGQVLRPGTVWLGPIRLRCRKPES